jgi:hypothetical protein
VPFPHICPSSHLHPICHQYLCADFVLHSFHHIIISLLLSKVCSKTNLLLRDFFYNIISTFVPSNKAASNTHKLIVAHSTIPACSQYKHFNVQVTYPVSHLRANCGAEVLMSNWLILQYIYTLRWSAVCSSGTESHNSRMSYNKCGLVYFIKCVQICGCWYSGVSDTVRCAWQWWQQRVLQHQWGATGCLYCENMFWRCVSLSGSEITKHAVSANNTTQHNTFHI